MAAAIRIPELKSTRFTRAFEKRCSRAIQEGELLAKGDRVLVGVSGGPDSTALLAALAHVKKGLGVKVAAGHFDHRLRSREEAEGDAVFVQALCRRLRVPVEVGGGDVRARARRRKESIEEAARAMRYAFLKRAAKKLGADVVAVAHNRGDQAETVLMRMIRGSGLDGVAGMRPRARWPFGRGPAIVRPLLDVPRVEIERYCAELGLEPRRDPTNDLPVATRNRIRNELMPVLRTFNPRVEEALARLAEAAAEDLSFIELFSDSYFRQAASRDRSGIAIDRGYLESAHRAIASRLVKEAAAVIACDVELKREDVEGVLSTLKKRRARATLPGALIAVTDSYNVTIWRGEPRKARRVPHVNLRTVGETRAGPWVIQTERGEPNDFGPIEDGWSATIDARVGSLAVRSRQPGDRLRPLGLGGTKKVQDILVDAKVPVEERDAVPIVCDERGIVWVVGHCIDERVKVTKDTKQVIYMKASRV